MRRLACLAALVLAIACLDDRSNPLGPAPMQSPLPQGLVVSDPQTPRASLGSAAQRAPRAATATTVAYVSLPPGTVADGGLATIQDPTTGSQVVTAMSDGGFDPVPIIANDGDNVVVVVERTGGGTLTLQMTVALARPPVVVRTDPPPKKRDVPLNASVHVVFSEPVTSGSLNGIRLQRGGFTVAGRVRASVDGLSADFLPDAQLAPNADYALVIPTSVTDASGDHLSQNFVATFTTGTGVIAASVATAEPALWPDFFSGSLLSFSMTAVRWSDGTFTGNFSIFYPQWGARFFGRVECFSIAGGDSAWVAGVIDAANDTSYIGLEIGWRTVDHGPPASGVPDEVSYAVGLAGDSLGTPQDFCANQPLVLPHDPQAGTNAPLTLSTLLSGDVVVNASGPPPPPPPPLSEIAFAAWPNGGIQVINADGTGGRVLTTYSDWNPAWSPDGTKLAFARRGPSNGAIFVMGADGSALTRLTSGAFTDVEPAWSPDGSRIAFQRNGGITVMNADGSGQRALTPSGCDFYPTWSPDGAKIAFASCRAGTQQVFVMNADGSGIRQITSDPEGDYFPRWSPDGAAIAFEHSSMYGQRSSVYVIRPDGTGLRQVAVLGRTPSWSPDSRDLVFEWFGLHTVGADGMGSAPIGNGFDPAWSPSGTVPARPPLAASVTITPSTGAIGVGDTVPFVATVRDAAGNVLPNRMVAWITSDSGHAILTTPPPRYSRDWSVMGIAAGSAAVVAMADGHSDTADVVVAADTISVAAVTAGGEHSCAIATTQRAYCWGSGVAGKLGSGNGTNSATPLAVTGGVSFASLTAGGQHACGAATTGTVYCWGENNFGQLGNGTSVRYDATPTALAGNPSFRVLAAGSYHTCGLTPDRTASCWGWNAYGQLGNGSTSNSLTPLAVFDTLHYTTIAAGLYHTCGLSATGAAYCWGDNSWGQLGADSISGSTRPIAVSGGLSFVALTAGSLHTCGLTADSTAYCWGANSFGQLGNGTTVGGATAVTVSGGLKFTTLAAGNIHTCGVTTAGAAYCWGGNSDGQLGDGSTTDSPVPVVVSGGLSFGTITTQYRHTCGLTIDGLAYCWGANASGQLGDGTTTRRTTPVKVVGQP